MKKLLATIFLGAWVFPCLGTTHFTEVYPVDGAYRVDTFTVERGRLQEFSGGKLFRYESAARLHAGKILARNSSERPVLVTTEGRGDPLWKVASAWNEEWEQKYATWVDSNLTVNFFRDHGIAVDCADVPYALRWIFARINSLPASATLGGTGTVVTQDVYREAWKNLPVHRDWDKDKRFLAALDWILDSAFTGTLLKDTFPVEINSSTIRAGLTIHLGSHAEVFSHTTHDPSEVPVTVMSSSVPQAIRSLSSRVFMDKKGISEDKGGLLRFRWPVKTPSGWKITARENMPHYSLEQYRKDLCPEEKHFAFCVIKKAGLTINPEIVVKKLEKNIEDNLAFRSSVVVDGSRFCASNDCTPGTTGWEDWSTPGRDGRLRDLFENTYELSVNLKQEEIFLSWLRTYRLPGRPASFSLEAFRKNLSRDIISSDPRDSLSARWGDSPSGVFESVTSLIRDGEIYRNEAIQNADPCRRDAASCRQNPEAIPLYSTLDLDLSRRKVLTGWMSYCRENACPENSLSNDFRKIWTESPAPWDSEISRRGNAGLLKTSHVLLADTISPAFTDQMILDGKRLYDGKLSREKLTAKSMVYENQALVTLSDSTVSFLDQNLRVLKTFPAPEGSQKILCLDRSRVFIAGEKSGILLDTKERKILLSLNYKSFLSGDKAIILRSNSDMLVTSAGVSNLFSLSGRIESFISLSPDEVLAVMSDGDESHAGFLSLNTFQEVMKADEGNLRLERLNSEYVMVKDMTLMRDFHPSIVYDSKKNPWKPEGYFSAGLSPDKDSRIVLEADFNSRLPWLFTGKTGQELPFHFAGTDPIVSASSDRIVTMENETSRVLDFEGKEISRSTEFVNGFCHSLVWSDQCADADGNLNFSLAIRKNIDPDGYLSWMLYTHKNGARGYGIRVYSGEREEKTAMLISTGSAMRPHPGVLIWNP